MRRTAGRQRKKRSVSQPTRGEREMNANFRPGLIGQAPIPVVITADLMSFHKSQKIQHKEEVRPRSQAYLRTYLTASMRTDRTHERQPSETGRYPYATKQSTYFSRARASTDAFCPGIPLVFSRPRELKSRTSTILRSNATHLAAALPQKRGKKESSGWGLLQVEWSPS